MVGETPLDGVPGPLDGHFVFALFLHSILHSLLTWSTTTMMDQELSVAHVVDHVSGPHATETRIGVRPCDGSMLSLSIA